LTLLSGDIDDALAGPSLRLTDINQEMPGWRGACYTGKCHNSIADRGAYSVIPPRTNAKPWKAVTAVAASRNEALRASKYLGRARWRRWSEYDRRSRVEAKLHCAKLLDQRLMARDFTSQVAEI